MTDAIIEELVKQQAGDGTMIDDGEVAIHVVEGADPNMLNLEDVQHLVNRAAVEVGGFEIEGPGSDLVFESLFIMAEPLLVAFKRACDQRDQDEVDGVVTIGDEYEELLPQMALAIREACEQDYF